MNGTSSSSRKQSPARKADRSNRLIKHDTERSHQSLTKLRGRENGRSPSPKASGSMVAVEGRPHYRDAAQESFSSAARFRTRERQSSPPARSNGGIVRSDYSNERRQQNWPAQNGRLRNDREQRQFPDSRQRSTVRSFDHSRFPKDFPDDRRTSFQNRRYNNSTRNRHEQDSWERATGRVRGRNDPQPSNVTQRTDSALSKKSDGSTRKSFSTSSRSSNHVQKYRKKVPLFADTDKPSDRTGTSSSANSTTDETRTKSALDRSGDISRASSAERNGDHPVNGTSHSKEETSPVILTKKWIRQMSSSGKPYYFNTVTRKSVWTKPEDWVDDEDITAKDTPNDNESEPEKPAPSQPKRKLSEVEPSEVSTPSAKRAQKIVIPENLLGSPISEDSDAASSVASPTPSEKMDVSDVDESNCTARGSRNIGATSNRTSPVSRRKSESVKTSHSPRKEAGSPPRPSTARRTKAPTKEDLRKLAESDDPEKRRTEKLERVANWMSNLGGTPTEVHASPALEQDPGSPVSSESYDDSPCPSKKDVEIESLLKPEELESNPTPGTSLISPLTSNSFSRIQLPLFDLPDHLESSILTDLSVFLDSALSVLFRNVKMDNLEEERFRQLTEARLALFSCTGEKAVQMKSNLTDIRHKTTTTRSQTNDIMFLDTLENELWQSIHARSEVKTEQPSSRAEVRPLTEAKPAVAADLKTEPVEAQIIKKEPVEVTSSPDLKNDALSSLAPVSAPFLLEERNGITT